MIHQAPKRSEISFALIELRTDLCDSPQYIPEVGSGFTKVDGLNVPILETCKVKLDVQILQLAQS